MSEVGVLYSILGLIFFLFALYFTSASKAKPPTLQADQEGNQCLKTLSTSSSSLRSSLGVSVQKLELNTPMSITISVDNIIAKVSNGNAEFINKIGVDRVIALLCEFAHIRLLVAATSDAQEELIRQQLDVEVLRDTASLPFPLLRHRVLFYSTQIGKTAMVRQILPDVHIDADASLCEAMKPFVGSVIQVREGEGQGAEAVTGRRVIASLEQLLPPA